MSFLCFFPQFCKNIVLAGVGSLTLMDDRLVTENATHANFLITAEESKLSGRSLAEVYCNSLREFNPMVHVSVEKGSIWEDLFSPVKLLRPHEPDL
ncbi:SUMO-activating enzyme subunit 1B-1 [Platanthera zijinensis]|uniref:SUMO-activating enzyme subunit 1B-1 n=1 Tax=Platanthera zijinensis TaxID=2320716 RepID=A0AAP0B2C4_9ASPA